MILPTKKLSADNALLTLGADVLRLLNEPKTISRLWSELKTMRAAGGAADIPYDWFVLSLDLLFVINAIWFAEGRLSRRHK